MNFADSATTKQLVALVDGLAGQQAMPDDWWKKELSQLIVRIAVLEGAEQYVERLALCPDHRDKTTGRCVVCQAEHRTRQEILDDRRQQESGGHT